MRVFPVLLLAAALNPCAAYAGEAREAHLYGRWAVDTTRLPAPPEARPKQVTISFAAAEPGRLMARVEVIDPAGNQLLAEGVTPLDGTPTPVKSNFEADLSATLMPTPDVLVMMLGKDGMPASTRIYAVAADGKSMVETVSYFGEDGKPVMRKNYFSRIR
ncbi:MAG: hypothetical protein JNL89_08035 [Rhodanobacteraceae bacterium]|nr:hypothetical protein [Rhodanobacteraceae bacterium]